MSFNAQQTKQLLSPIAPSRVLRDGKGHSHVSQQDVTAHLIRVFGFGGFDVETLDLACVFETPRDERGVKFDVCYRARVRLTVKDTEGHPVAVYEDGSTATAQNQTRGDGHDLAFKSALSLAKKRAAINLGDQFGLSLYNKGQMEALVRGTLVMPDDDAPAEQGDMQQGVPQQVSMGNDETTYEDGTEPEQPAAPEATRQTGPSAAPVDDAPSETVVALVEATRDAQTVDQLRDVWTRASEAGVIHESIGLHAEGGEPLTFTQYMNLRKGELAAA